jgi:hypothetical protein
LEIELKVLSQHCSTDRVVGIESPIQSHTSYINYNVDAIVAVATISFETSPKLDVHSMAENIREGESMILYAFLERIPDAPVQLKILGSILRSL